MPYEAAHISSLVVHCLPEQLQNVLSQVEKFAHVEVHAPNPAGKFVAVLETENEHGILSTINDIQAMPGVLAATMVYHEIDDAQEGELEDENNS